MRIAVLSDSHIDHNVHGLNAHAAWEAATKWIAEHGAELAIIAGDMFHTGYSKGVALNVAADGFARMTKAGVPVLVVVGNHEWIGYEAGASPSSTGKCLPVELLDSIPKVRVLRRPKLVSVPGSDLVVAAIPWPEPGQGAREVESAVARIADNALKHDGPRIAVAHAAVEGATVKTQRGSELDLWRFGEEPVVSLNAIDIPEAFGRTVLGHVHRRQALSDTCGYVGSTECMSFSDEGMAKGFSVFEWDEQTKGWSEELIPVGIRSFLTLNVGEEFDPYDQILDMDEGAFVRFRVHGGGAGMVAEARSVIRENGGVFMPKATVYETTASESFDDDLDAWMEEAAENELAHEDMELTELMPIWYNFADVPEEDRPGVTRKLEELQGQAL